MADSGEKNAHFLAQPKSSIPKDGTLTIYPYEMDIIWGGDDRYWSVPKANDDKSPAVLHQVCWLEVTTCVDKIYINPDKKYNVGFEISFEADAFGWGDKHPIYFMTKRGKVPKWTKKTLREEEAVGPDGETKTTKTQMVIDKASEKDDSISFGLYEVWSGKWKGGLKIHNAFVIEI